jgi:SAM-dependent methyltransferase
MSFKTHFYPETRFGGFTNVDGTIVFYSRVNALIQPSSVIVDFGCGRGQYLEDQVTWRRNLRILKDKGERVIGLDIDPRAAGNPYVDEYRTIVDGQPWPIQDGSIDLVVCDSVVEHLAVPNEFFAEAHRVLIPQRGFLCIRTPNAWSYVGIAQRLIPNRYHANVLQRAQEFRKEEDVFPTFYRCNTIKALQKMLRAHSFDSLTYGYESEPSYLEFSRFFYWLGVIHQRLAPRSLSPVLHAFGRRL